MSTAPNRPPPWRQRPGALCLAAGVWATVGLASFLVGAVVASADWSFARHHGDTAATVTALRHDDICDNGVGSCADLYYPTVRFVLGDGSVIEAETTDPHGEPTEVRPGRALVVHYRLDDPSDVQLAAGWPTFDKVMIAFFGFDAVLSGLLMVRYLGRASRARARLHSGLRRRSASA